MTDSIAASQVMANLLKLPINVEYIYHTRFK